jgi:hypothetical protein
VHERLRQVVLLAPDSSSCPGVIKTPSGTMEDLQASRSFQSVSELQFGIVSDSA